MKPFDRRPDVDARDDLDGLDAALQGDERADPAIRALVEDVRASRRTLDPDARERLEQRARDAVSGRTTTAVAGSETRRRAPRRWRIAVAVAAVAAIVVPVTVVVLRDQAVDVVATGLEADAPSSLSRDSRAPERRTSVSPGAQSPRRPVLESATRDSRSGATSRPFAREARPIATGPRMADERRVIRGARQTVRVAASDVARAATRVTEIVAEQGGYVDASSVRESGSRAGGTFEIVVPSGRLDASIAALGTVGRPVSLERASTDVTDRSASLRDRLGDLRADRSAVRLQLAQAVDVAKRAAKRRELRLLSSRIARLEGEQRQLRNATSTSRLTLRLTTASGSAASSAPDDDRWGMADAWRDAGHVLQVGAGVLLIAVTILVPLAALVGLVALLDRRRRAGRKNRTIAGS